MPAPGIGGWDFHEYLDDFAARSGYDDIDELDPDLVEHLTELSDTIQVQRAAGTLDRMPGGALSDFLVAIGRRDADAEYPVGETP